MISLVDNSTSHIANVIIKSFEGLFSIVLFPQQYSLKYTSENFISSLKISLFKIYK